MKKVRTKKFFSIVGTVLAAYVAISFFAFSYDFDCKSKIIDQEGVMLLSDLRISILSQNLQKEMADKQPNKENIVHYETMIRELKEKFKSAQNKEEKINKSRKCIQTAFPLIKVLWKLAE